MVEVLSSEIVKAKKVAAARNTGAIELAKTLLTQRISQRQRVTDLASQGVIGQAELQKAKDDVHLAKIHVESAADGEKDSIVQHLNIQMSDAAITRQVAELVEAGLQKEMKRIWAQSGIANQAKLVMAQAEQQRALIVRQELEMERLREQLVVLETEAKLRKPVVDVGDPSAPKKAADLNE
jgi:hypothetical protein